MAKLKFSLDEMISQMSIKPAEFIRTGILAFDLLFEGKGLPWGGLHLLHSPSGYGKSTLTLSLARSLADKGYKSLFCMSEPSIKLAEDMGIMDERYADRIKLLQLATYEELEQLFRAFLDSDYTVMFLDSLTAMSVSAIANNEIATTEIQPAANARVKAELMKFFQANLLKVPNKAVICIAQQRANFNAGWNGPQSTLAGSSSDRYYASTVIEVRGDAQVPDLANDSKAVIGKSGYLVCPEKNRYSPPRTSCPVTILFGRGVSNISTVQDWLKFKGPVTQGGARYKVMLDGEEHSCVGRVGYNEWVRDNMERLSELFYESAAEYFDALRKGYRP